MAKIAENKILSFDIHDIYNEYGIFSRQLSIQYFNFYLNNLNRIENPEVYRGRRTVTKEFEVGKMILGGSVFYRVLAERITSSITKGYNYLMLPASYDLKNALNLINQLITQSYSEYFKQHLQTFRDTRLNWEDENHIPEATFYKPDGSTIKLDELVKDKPTVLYISNNWGTYRYDFDAEAKNNPAIRYVMIVEGDNLAKWQDYIERAEPEAEQLFLLNNEHTLEAIFLRTNKLYIVYGKNGKLLDYDVEQKMAITLAKQNLQEKKELNKSQLQNIIIVLLVVLFLLTFGLIIWKWRTRQRIRKEQQQRRLRELELTAIRSQMNPHFLFNCLNSVQNLVQQNKGREAHLYLADFAGLIRNVLNNSEKEEVSLAEELDMVQKYLSLEKLRFDFDYQINVDEEVDLHNFLVPSMLVQPFAENAVIHGLQSKTGKKHLKIDIKKNSAEEGRSKGIVISIEDNGVGREEAQKRVTGSNGRGTKLVQERLAILQQQQNEKYSLQTTDLNGNGATGTKVELFVPEEN